MLKLNPQFGFEWKPETKLGVSIQVHSQAYGLLMSRVSIFMLHGQKYILSSQRQEQGGSAFHPIVTISLTNLQVNHKHITRSFSSSCANWVQVKRACIQSLWLLLLIWHRLEKDYRHWHYQLHWLRLLQTHHERERENIIDN